MRGAIFSILQSAVGGNWQVLDLYAGSGALGIEALSRGAGWVDFVESNPKCVTVIKENLALTGFASRAKVYSCTANKALSVLDKLYDIVMLDPPYSDTSFLDTLASLLASHLVGTNSTIIVEYSSHQALPSQIEAFQLLKSRDYGDTRLSVYRQEVNN